MKKRESLWVVLRNWAFAECCIFPRTWAEPHPGPPNVKSGGDMKPRGLIMRWALRMVLALFILTSMPPGAFAALQQYRDWSLGTLGMILQSLAYGEAKLYVLGESSTPGIYQTAMLISSNAEVEDGGTKNTILFECGMHGREWLSAESCYWLIDYLLQNRRNPMVRELLSHTDIWVIPQSNPAGRAIDDLGWGDPTQFIYVCEKGDPGKMGTLCSLDTDCGTGGECNKNGWRANANRFDCPLGVDPARNFSSGWERATSVCDSEKRCGEGGIICTSDNNCTGTGNNCENTAMKYRGPSPFSEPETLNLRRFVNNHMISMAAISHTNGEIMWNNWNDFNAPTEYMTNQLNAISIAGSAPYAPSPQIDVWPVGGGYGQFSAWLTQLSDVVGEPDAWTQRGISTFYFELPMKKDAYDANFRNAVGDTSNSFHPSSDEVKVLYDSAIRDLFLYLTLQARSPQCPVDVAGNPINAECLTRDFGLVGAKIANATNQPGLIAYNAETRQETLPQGAHQIVFSVQNMSAGGTSNPPRSTHAHVSITKEGSTPVNHTIDVSLNPGERATYSVDHNFEMENDYTVLILLDIEHDDFVGNNMKIFKFRVPSPFVPYTRVSLGSSVLRFTNQGKALGYSGAFSVDAPFDPRKQGVRITLYGHRSTLPNGKPGLALAEYVLPRGMPWWAQSKPGQGLWVYSDPKGSKSPIRRLVISKQYEPFSGMKNLTTVTMSATGGALSSFVGVQSYRVDFDILGTDLRLSSLAQGTRPTPPPKKVLPDDETEVEPYGPPPNNNQ